MRKNAIVLGACLLAVCLLGGCGNDSVSADLTTVSVENTKVPGTEQSKQPEQLPAEGVLSCERTENTVRVSVTLAKHAGEEVTLLALCDPAYQYTWWENPDACLSDLGQLSLDDQGKGVLELRLQSNANPVYILLTAPDGYYVVEVK